MIVIDASVTVHVVLPILANGRNVMGIVEGWYRRNEKIVAPEIWLPETVSVIRHGIYTGMITTEEGDVAIDDVFSLGVEVILSEDSMCKEAIVWADRLGQSKAYDSSYVALADRLGASFWTADKRLANGARQLGATWVHWIGEEIDGIS